MGGAVTAGPWQEGGSETADNAFVVGSDVGDGGDIFLVDQIKHLFKTCTEDDFFQ